MKKALFLIYGTNNAGIQFAAQCEQNPKYREAVFYSNEEIIKKVDVFTKDERTRMMLACYEHEDSPAKILSPEVLNNKDLMIFEFSVKRIKRDWFPFSPQNLEKYFKK